MLTGYPWNIKPKRFHLNVDTCSHIHRHLSTYTCIYLINWKLIFNSLSARISRVSTVLLCSISIFSTQYSQLPTQPLTFSLLLISLFIIVFFFLHRLLNPKIVRACTLVLTDWNHIPTKSLKAAVTILYRIAVACSCPAMLYHVSITV